MKKRKYYGRKIKRSKINLYPRRKTKAQKILSTVLLIILLLALGFLGYCLGKPLLEYFEKNQNMGSSPVWTPPEDTESTSAQTEPPVTTAPEGETAVTTASESESLVSDGISYTVNVPASALLNYTSLSTFAKKSASEGFTAAMVQLKDGAGHLRYASDIEAVQNTDVIIGVMTAEEICSALRENGLEPVAVVSALADNAGCVAIPDMSYKVTDEDDVSWLDYTAENPVRWANPENEATLLYIKEVKDELTASGFTEIIQTNIVFPDFQEYDKKYVEAKYFSADRYKLLSGAVMYGHSIEVNAEDVISGQFTGTAEVLKNKTQLTNNKIVVKISRGAFPVEEGYPADAGSLLEIVMAQAMSKNSGFTLAPMIEGKDFLPAEISDMQKTAKEMGFTDFYVK